MTKTRTSLLVIASTLVLINAFFNDSLLQFLLGIIGVLGVATWGYSTKEVIKIVKDKVNTVT